ncbi:MAG: TrkA family potassium uptake protein [Ruminococcaceae bacterium]|nr:TrkA family potassium uptake protein [Oscillospiraceae bacterium]
MKSFLVIGLNSFGHHLCRELYKHKGEVMIADKDELALEDALKYSVSAKVGDCSDDDVLSSFDVKSFDVCFVCLSGDFQNSLQITSLLKELGAKKVISKADNDIHAKFLLRNGADEVIYPEREAAESVAVSESSDSIFHCIPLYGEYYIYEILPGERWIGKSTSSLPVKPLGLRKNRVFEAYIGNEHIISDDEHLVVMGRAEDIKKLIQ